MIGVYYKNNAPGGMAAVIQGYKRYFEILRYIPSYKLTNIVGKFWYAISAYSSVFFLLLFDRRIKILHIHTAQDNSFYRKMYFVKLAALFHKKIMIHVHGQRFKDFYEENAKKENIITNLNMADILVVLSKSWKQWFESIGISSEKIIILDNIIPYPVIKKVSAEKKLKLLFLGEIGIRKGVFDVLQVIANNNEFYKNKLIFKIGGNKEEEKLRNFIENNNLAEIVHFEGWVSADNKTHLLNWADVLILPSFNEGLPIAILEAMSYGCAIISTLVGGISEILHDYENGIVVHPGNLDEIHSAILYMIDNPEKISVFGMRSKEISHSFFPDSVIPKLKEIYMGLL
jgi:glycosyltransferase involved in cell wall biosynthesis